MKILFFTAPRPHSNETAMHMGDGRPPMGLGYLSGYIEQFGHESKIVDIYHFGGGRVGDVARKKTVNCGVLDNDNPVDIYKDIEEYRPDFLGMYLSTVSFYQGIDLAKTLKDLYPDIPLIVGGPHAIELPNSLTPYFDYIVCGEGEQALLNIIENKAKPGIVLGDNIDDLDLLPLPDYRHFIDQPYNWKLELFKTDVTPVISINSTRGCPFSCMFCGVANTKFRGVSAGRLVDYIMGMVDKYGLRGVYFREDNFTVKSKRVDEFCDALIAANANIEWACESRVKNLSARTIEKMAESGCVGLYMGVESGSPRMLEYMKKGEAREDFIEKFPIFRSNNIRTYTTWIYGLPSETQKDRDLSDQFCEDLNPDSVDKFVYLGQPGSDFYRMLDASKTYELKEPNGIFYIKGFMPLAKQIYGEDDPRVEFIENLYERYKIIPGPMEPYYLDEQAYVNLSTKKVRKQLSVK